MLLTSSGLVNTEAIQIVLMSLMPHYAPFSLPACVDFDSVYDVECPSRCLPRSNIDNAVENTFYISNPQQALVNQDKLGKLPSTGNYFSILPVSNLSVESNTQYAHGLSIEVFSIGEDTLGSLISEIKNIYIKLNISSEVRVDRDKDGIVEFYFNDILIGTASTIKLPSGVTLARATVLEEPVFSYAVSLSSKT